MKRITLLLLSVLTAHAGQTLTLSNAQGDSKSFYVVGCTPTAVICKAAASDKQTFNIPFDQLPEDKNHPSIYDIRERARQTVQEINKDPTARKSTAAFRAPSKWQTDTGDRYPEPLLKKNPRSFANEKDIVFRLEGIVSGVTQTGALVLDGKLIDYSNNKTKRISFDQTDSRRFDNKITYLGSFWLYGQDAKVGSTIQLDVFSTPLVYAFVATQGNKTYEAAIENLMAPMPADWSPAPKPTTAPAVNPYARSATPPAP